MIGSIDSDSNSNDAKDGKETPVLEKMLAEEVITQNIKGGSFIKEMKAAKESNDSRKGNMTTNVSGLAGNKTAAAFAWDDLDLKELNDTAQDRDNMVDIDSQFLEFSPFPKDRSAFKIPETQASNNWNIDNDNENELMTQDKLNATFNNNCYKLFFNGDIDTTASIQATENFTQFADFKNLIQNQIDGLNNAEEEAEAEKSMLGVKVMKQKFLFLIGTNDMSYFKKLLF